MTILYEVYKDAYTTTEYYGQVIDDVIHISYNFGENNLIVFTKKTKLVLDLKLAKRLEICEDGE